jgi:hypothetical protein
MNQEIQDSGSEKQEGLPALKKSQNNSSTSTTD